MKSRSIFKALALTLAIVLCVGAMPTVSLAAEEVDSGSCGDNAAYVLDSDGVLTISGTGDMTRFAAVSGREAPWYSNRKSIKTVVIQSGVTSIGDYAFADCTNLTSITIADSVNSIKDQPFFGCSKLTTIYVSSNFNINNLRAEYQAMVVYTDRQTVEEPGNAAVSLNATIDATTFKVTVPTFITVAVDADGNVVTATSTQLVNSSRSPVEVTAVSVTAAEDWTLVGFDTDFTKEKVDTKKFGMTINGVDVIGSGVTESFDVIDGNASCNFTYTINTNGTTSAIQTTIAEVVFTINWYK